MTGVDIVPRALRRARDRIRDAGVEMRLVQGDVTRLRECGVGSGYDLVLDTGTFHGLTPAQRLDMGREVAAITRRRPPWSSTASRRGRAVRCPAAARRPTSRRRSRAGQWPTVVDADTEPDPIARAFRFDEVFYRLQRR